METKLDQKWMTQLQTSRTQLQTSRTQLQTSRTQLQTSRTQLQTYPFLGEFLGIPPTHSQTPENVRIRAQTQSQTCQNQFRQAKRPQNAPNTFADPRKCENSRPNAIADLSESVPAG